VDAPSYVETGLVGKINIQVIPEVKERGESYHTIQINAIISGIGPGKWEIYISSDIGAFVLCLQQAPSGKDSHCDACKQ